MVKSWKGRKGVFWVVRLEQKQSLCEETSHAYDNKNGAVTVIVFREVFEVQNDKAKKAGEQGNAVEMPKAETEPETSLCEAQS